jgi:hypothetical protein
MQRAVGLSRPVVGKSEKGTHGYDTANYNDVVGESLDAVGCHFVFRSNSTTLKKTRLVRVFFRPSLSSFRLINLNGRMAPMEHTMLNVRLPDGSSRQFEGPVTVAQVASSIAPSLAKAALAGKVDGKVVDTSFLIEKDADLAIVTDKDPEGLEVIRHSTAHLLAYAVKELFPEAQVTIGPVIENGFYYDFSYKRPFTPDDLQAIERPSRTSSRSARTTRPRSSRRSRRTKTCRCTPKASSPTCAAAHTCRRPAS